MNEAQRQQALLAALTAGVQVGAPLALREAGDRAARGLEAYRANAEALADRALGAAFPTVRTMVGADTFMHLAREFWRSQMPERGDLGEWGDGFPAWLQRHAALAPWPYLGDCARLDLAVHRCERAADAVLDAASLTRLESTDPARLRILLMPGTALLQSPWPIASIHDAHRLEGDAAERAFAELRGAIAQPRGEDVFVARRGWRAVVHRLDAREAAWTQDLLAGVDLGTAIERAGDAFDFSAWLARALSASWLNEVALSAGDGPLSREA